MINGVLLRERVHNGVMKDGSQFILRNLNGFLGNH